MKGPNTDLLGDLVFGFQREDAHITSVLFLLKYVFL